MSTSIIQRYQEFNASSTILSSVKKNKSGGKTVYINAPDNKKLYIQFPFMRSPYGLSSYTDEATGKTSFSLDLSFDRDNEEALVMKDKLRELDDIILKTVAENSKEWLGKPYNIEVIREALYKPIVRPGKDDWPESIKLKVMTKPNGDFLPEAYDMSQKSIPIDSIEKGQKCMCICDINQIWFVDNKFGVSIRVSQVLCERSQKLPSFAFQGVDTEVVSNGNDDCEIDE